MPDSRIEDNPSKAYLFPVADAIDWHLEEHFIYGKGSEITDILSEGVENLRLVEIDRSDLEVSTELSIIEYSKTRIIGHTAIHGNMLSQHGKIAIVTNGSANVEWVEVGSDRNIEQAQSNISEIDPEETANIPWLEILNQQTDTDVLQETSKDIISSAGRLSETLSRLLPEIVIVKVLDTSSRLPWRRGREIPSIDISNEVYAEALKDLPGKTLRTVEELANFLSALLENPGRLLSDFIVDKHVARIESITKKITDASIARVHSSTIDLTLNSSARAKKKAAYKKQPKSTDSGQTVRIEEIEQDVIHHTETGELVDIGEHVFDFTWLEDSKCPLPVKKLEGSQRDVYVVYAEPDSLKEIATRVKRDASVNAKGQTKFESAAEQQARRMSEGIMPFQSSNSVKRLRLLNGHFKSAYKDLGACWYTFDISPNAPRIYFTLRECPDEIAGEKPKKDSKLMVIFAETDKANQMEFFTKLTNRSHAALKNTGVGSI